MKLPKIKVYELGEGKKNKLVRFFRVFLTANIFYLSFLLYKQSSKNQNSLSELSLEDLESRKLAEEATIISESENS